VTSKADESKHDWPNNDEPVFLGIHLALVREDRENFIPRLFTLQHSAQVFLYSGYQLPSGDAL
jgi:hypothetical protein